MPYKYIGRTLDFKGKSLWEIIGNLKNFGIGRIVARNMFERYPEPTYMKIMKVDALPNPENPSLDNMRKVKVICEKTFRGKKLPQPVVILAASYKCDYKLIPKNEEADYCKGTVETEVKILPKYTKFPPLMRELIIREGKANGTPIDEPKLELVYKEQLQNQTYRIQNEGDIPTIEIAYGLGKPKSPNLYKGIII